MKEYLAPDFEKIEYNIVEDCLKGSNEVPYETEDVGQIIDDLY